MKIVIITINTQTYVHYLNIDGKECDKITKYISTHREEIWHALTHNIPQQICIFFAGYQLI